MENDLDIIEFQDRVGYVDTGISQPATLAYATPVSSHIILKEPKPQKQVPIIDKKRSQQEALKTYQPKLSSAETKSLEQATSSEQVYQQPTANVTSMYHSPQLTYQPLKSEPEPSNPPKSTYRHRKTPEHLYQPIVNPDYQPQRHKRVPDNHHHYYQEQDMTYKGKERVTNTYQQNREIKELMVNKLYELAEMISHINIDDHDEPPRPSPSKSDPPPYYHQPTLRRKSSRPFIVPSPEDHHYYYPYSHEDYYNYYYDEPVVPRQRRKSIGGNYNEEHYTLRRKGSRGNMKRPIARQQHSPPQHYQYPYYYPPYHHDPYYNNRYE